MSVEPRLPQHADTQRHLGRGYMLERHLVGYHTPRAGGVGTPKYLWRLYRNGRLVSQGKHHFPLRWAARRGDYG